MTLHATFHRPSGTAALRPVWALAFVFLLTSAFATNASAEDLLNTWSNAAGSGQGQYVENYPAASSEPDGNGGLSPSNGPVNYQSLAMQFNAGNTNTLTDLTVYMTNAAAQGDGADPTAGIELGIMADNGGAPSGIFLQQAFVFIPPGAANATPTSLSGLDWALDPNTKYWLVAVALSGAEYSWEQTSYYGEGATGFSDGAWETSPVTFGATINGGWTDPSLTGPTITSAPEPGSIAAFGVGLMAIGAFRMKRYE